MDQELKCRIACLKVEKEELEEIVKNLRADKDALTIVDLLQGERKILQDQNRELEREIQEKKKICEEYGQRAAKLNGGMQEQESVEATLLKQVYEEKMILEEKVYVLEKELKRVPPSPPIPPSILDDLLVKNEYLEMENKVLGESITDYRDQNMRLRDQENKSWQLQRQLEKEKKDLVEKCQNSELVNEKLQTLVKQLQEEKNQLEARVMLLEVEEAKLVVKKHSLKKMVKALEEDNNELEEDRQSLETTVKLLQGEEKKLLEKNHSLETLVKELQEEKEKKKGHIRRWLKIRRSRHNENQQEQEESISMSTSPQMCEEAVSEEDKMEEAKKRKKEKKRKHKQEETVEKNQEEEREESEVKTGEKNETKEKKKKKRGLKRWMGKKKKKKSDSDTVVE